MKSPFDDPEFRAQLAAMGIVHKPGMAQQLLSEMAPLLAAEGIDLDDLDGSDLDAVNEALSRATARHNLELFTPVGPRRSGALAVLRHVAEALADGDDERAAAVLATIEPDPPGEAPAISHVIGVALGLLDTWHTDPALRGALAATRVPRWNKVSRAAAIDILALARKGRAFASLDGLHRRHRGLAVFEGSALVVAASVASWSARESVPPRELAARVLADSAPQRSGAAFGVAADRRDGAVPSPVQRSMLSLVPPPGADASAARGFVGPSAHGRGGSKKRKGPGHPARRGIPPVDRFALRQFAQWLEQQPSFVAATVSDEVSMLEALLKIGRSEGIDLHNPLDAEQIVDLIFEAEDPDNPEATQNALEVVHTYVHFRLDTASDAESWDEAHDVVEEALADFTGGPDPIEYAIDAADQVPAEERYAALARTPIVAAVADLLAWVGTGRAVTQSGAVRRVDIEHVAGLLGISAIGVSKRPISDRSVTDDLESSPPGPIHALAMADVPMLTSWWQTLAIANVIEMTSSRVRQGLAAAEWGVEGRPSPELAEMIVGIFVAETLMRGLESSTGMFEHSVFDEAVRMLMAALVPELDGDGVDVDAGDDDGDDFLDSVIRAVAMGRLADLAEAGLLHGDIDQNAEVPVALRGAVARGVILAMAFLDTVDDRE